MTSALSGKRKLSISKNRANRVSTTKASRIGKNIISVVMFIYSFIAVYLIGNTVLSSFKTKPELINNTFGFPKVFTLASYQNLFAQDDFGRYFINSFILVIMGLTMLLLASSMVAYGLARFKFKGKDFLKFYFLIGLMFPIQLGILPLFIMLKALHLTNNLFGVALLYTANMSFPVFVFTKFFMAQPAALIESAKIDGASEFRIFWQIVLPTSKPVLFTIGLINLVIIWNDFYIPLVFLTKKSVRTLTLAVYTYMGNFLANWDLVFAAVTIALVPVVILYLFFSKYIVAGLTGGSVKE